MRTFGIIMIMASIVVILPVKAFCDTRDDAVEELRRQGVPFSIAGFAAGIRAGNTDMVRLFLQAGMSPNAVDGTGRPALVVAAGQPDTAVVALLLDYGAEVNLRQKDHQWTPLMEAATMGFEKSVHLLAARGAAINARDEMGVTALMEAVKLNRPDLVRTLLDAGADAGLTDNRGRTALMEAASRGCASAIPLLLEKRVDINQSSRSGQTALILAAAGGNTETVRHLLHAGADPGIKDVNGTTALMAAASKGDVKTVELLVEVSDLDVVDQHGRSALRYATSEGHDTVAKFLRQLASRRGIDRK